MRLSDGLILTAFLITLISAPAGAYGQTADPPSDTTPAASSTPSELVLPAHTGWATLAKDTAHDFWLFPRRRSTWVLLGAGALAALAVHPADDYIEDHIVGSKGAENFFKLGRWVGSAPVQMGTAAGLWMIGRYVLPPAANEPQTNKWSHLGFDLLRAQIEAQAVVHAIKYTARRDRPTGECCAFPSGHAATAFAAASVLERHFGYRGSWPAMVGAAYVGASRLVDNRHFASDVLFGAALGMATGWTVVGRHGREMYSLQPVAVKGGVMIALTRVEPGRRNRTE